MASRWGNSGNSDRLCSILKSRNITLPTKVCLVKAMVFLVVMYGCESWTIKKAECRRIDTFELWCCRRLLRVPWPTGRSNQSILKEISPELEGLMLKMKLQYFGHLMWRTDFIGEDHDAGKDSRQEEEGMTEDEMVGWHHQLDGHECEQAPRAGEGQGGLACCSPHGHRVRHNWASELMEDLAPWTGVESLPPTLGAWSLSRWTTREVLYSNTFQNTFLCVCVL